MDKPKIFLKVTPEEFRELMQDAYQTTGFEAVAVHDEQTESSWTEGLKRVFPAERADRWVLLSRTHEIHAEVEDHVSHRLFNADRQPIDDDGRTLDYGPTTIYDA